jgi:hypothetical protein
MPLGTPDDDVQLDIRLGSEGVARVAMSEAESAIFDGAIPWRTFRMYLGQTHYSVAYWAAATEAAHVIYESRLELSRLRLADFDANVTDIVAQPFLMRAIVDGVRRRHIPGSTFDDALRRVKAAPPPSARAVLLHMPWSHEVSTNLDEALAAESILTEGATR